MLNLTDCFTKFAWCFPMKQISAATVVRHLRKLFSNPENIPRKVHTDRGVGKLTAYSHVRASLARAPAHDRLI